MLEKWQKKKVWEMFRRKINFFQSWESFILYILLNWPGNYKTNVSFRIKKLGSVTLKAKFSCKSSIMYCIIAKKENWGEIFLKK